MNLNLGILRELNDEIEDSINNINLSISQINPINRLQISQRNNHLSPQMQALRTQQRNRPTITTPREPPVRLNPNPNPFSRVRRGAIDTGVGIPVSGGPESGESGTHMHKLIECTTVRQIKVETDICAICQEDFKVKNIVREIKKCNHYYHIECIEKWLSNKHTCPTCRYDLNEGEIGRCDR
jgi:hypothetical protein